MDGLLVVDKPVGPTSHDVVARVRRVLGERRVGHTGTLDPMASGVLPLVVGRATRLARFLSATDKVYEATIRLGVATDSGDSAGIAVGSAWKGPYPSREAIDRALDGFRGTFLQQPPAFSAKRIEGTRSYRLARNLRRQAPRDDRRPAVPAPVQVTTRAIEVLRSEDDLVTLRVECSAGFYVRSLAHDLGAALGTGAHLAKLCRTRSGDYLLTDAVALAALETDPGRAAAALVPLSRMLPAWPALTLTPGGLAFAASGRDLGPGEIAGGPFSRAAVRGSRVRLLSPDGALVALAEPASTPGLLHPSVVLV
jgi:tRNA pseudouridine55 synthase